MGVQGVSAAVSIRSQASYPASSRASASGLHAGSHIRPCSRTSASAVRPHIGFYFRASASTVRSHVGFYFRTSAAASRFHVRLYFRTCTTASRPHIRPCFRTSAAASRPHLRSVVIITGKVIHLHTPLFPQNGLCSSGKIVPTCKAFESS